MAKEGMLGIVCSGGCGKTTEKVFPKEFWEVRVAPEIRDA